MRRLLLCAAVVAAAALPAAHEVMAAPAAKVKVCHLNASNTPATFVYVYGYTYEIDYSDPDVQDYYYDYGYTYSVTYDFGNVIEVSESAVDAHVGHGDSTSYGTLTDSLIDQFESWDEDDFDWGYSYFYDYGSYTYSYEYVYNGDYTDGVVKNADCYVWKSTFVQD